MPFHQLGTDKYRRFGLDYALAGVRPCATLPAGAGRVGRPDRCRVWRPGGGGRRVADLTPSILLFT